MALDIGEKRVGIAISDMREKIASPVSVENASDVISMTPKFRYLLERWEVEKLIVGLPKTLSGEEGDQAIRIREIAERIALKYQLELEYVDERLSSKEAKNYMRECGMSERDMRGKIDMIAAQIFLQTYLDKNTKSEHL